MGLLEGMWLQEGPHPSFPGSLRRLSGCAGIWDPQARRARGVERLQAGIWHHLSSARMPTERDASAVTASTSSASAPGTLGTQGSGQEARRCMQAQYLPGTRN